MSYCPHCDHEKSKVIETRRYKDYENWTYRLRRCLLCKQTFKTVEMCLNQLQQMLSEEKSND